MEAWAKVLLIGVSVSAATAGVIILQQNRKAEELATQEEQE